MSDKRQAKKIFDRWKACLANADRSFDAVSGNFDELFYDFAKINIKADVAKSFLDEAVGAHLPAAMTAKWTYKRMDKNVVGTFEEFFTSWKKTISDKAGASYYAMFPFENDQEEEKKFGSMSKQEYMKQRRYAAQFPSIDLSEIPDLEELDEVAFDWTDVEGEL